MTVTELDSQDFSAFFESLWGKTPFTWQRELAEKVLDKDNGSADAGSIDRTHLHWPEAIALPTAAGKTACMDIAVFALAAQAPRLSRRQTITAPRRVFFVVDRRVIVDEAYERARELATKLRTADDGIMKRVADNLRCIAHGEPTGGGGEQPLAVHILRGGMYRSEAWMSHPLRAAVIASTVDQIGSRLLFRAYGRRPGTWSICAGLVANDSLILLDEAHCAQPFLQTLQAVQRFHTWGYAPLGRSCIPVVMSATPPAGLAPFEDRSAERMDPEHPLGRRQLAHKPAKLRPSRGATGVGAKEVLARNLVEAALGLIDERRRAIVVFVNRVATARETCRLLREKEEIDTTLLTGRMRPIDKDAVTRQRLRLLHSRESETRDLPRPSIVVATQTLEVGADLDFDGLVTECASLDALRQRFGRLNRMGRPIDARAVILYGEQAVTTDDPVYGGALAETWAWLNRHKDDMDEVDLGIAHLERTLPDRNALAALNAPSLDAPVMLPAHVDCWAQTAPPPYPSPDVAPFLHGPRDGVADIQVCWRADLTDTATERGKDEVLEILSLCPPSSTETIPVPIGVFKRWLSGESVEDHSADVEGIEPDAITDRQGETTVVRWRGSRTVHEDIASDPSRIRPGDVVVIPVIHAGDCRTLGDFPLDDTTSPPVLDVGDQAYRTARAKPILRLHAKLVEDWPDSIQTAKEMARDLLNGLEEKHETDPDEVADTLRDFLTELVSSFAELPDRWRWLSETAGDLCKEYRGSRLRSAYRIVGAKSLILVGRSRIPELAHEADSFTDEDDADASGISHKSGSPVKLRDHLHGVEAFVRRHVAGCGLSDEQAEAAVRAGLLHDLGKADRRFQSLLRRGARWSGAELLAKSAEMPKTRADYDRVRAAAGYPKGGRHELLSVRLAESAPALLPQTDDLRDLTLYLIATHHGWCRPFAPVIFDDEESDVCFELSGHRMYWSGPTSLERIDSGVADRYWRLVRVYGWWGLAWLEALVRLADWRQSEWEETHDDGE